MADLRLSSLTLNTYVIRIRSYLEEITSYKNNAKRDLAHCHSLCSESNKIINTIRDSLGRS